MRTKCKQSRTDTNILWVPWEKTRRCRNFLWLIRRTVEMSLPLWSIDIREVWSMWWWCLPVDVSGKCDDEESEIVFDDGWKRHRIRSNVNVDDTSLTWVFLFNRMFMTYAGFPSHWVCHRERRYWRDSWYLTSYGLYQHCRMLCDDTVTHMMQIVWRMSLVSKRRESWVSFLW